MGRSRLIARALCRALPVRTKCAGFDRPRLLPHVAFLVWLWRTKRGRPPHPSVPPSMHVAATGLIGSVYVEGVFPKTRCFVQVDTAAFALRWSHEHFLSLNLVGEIALVTPRKSKNLAVQAVEAAAHAMHVGMCASGSRTRRHVAPSASRSSAFEAHADCCSG